MLSVEISIPYYEQVSKVMFDYPEGTCCAEVADIASQEMVQIQRVKNQKDTPYQNISFILGISRIR